MKFKALVLFLLFFVAHVAVSQTARIPDFERLMKSLNAGERVRIVIEYQKCAWQDTTKKTVTPNAITGMDIDTYEFFAPGVIHKKMAFVVFANSKLIQNPKGKGFVYNYGKVRINADNTVLITAKYIDPKTFKEQMNEVFVGKLNDGTNKEAINLFK
jgi:hypothetical protein